MADQSVLEIVEFRAVEGVPEQEIVEAVEGLIPDLREIGGFVEQTLYAAQDGLWVILYAWEGMRDAQHSTERMTGRASFDRLMGMVDPATIRLTHAAPRPL